MYCGAVGSSSSIPLPMIQALGESLTKSFFFHFLFLPFVLPRVRETINRRTVKPLLITADRDPHTSVTRNSDVTPAATRAIPKSTPVA
jgi:hypothetical protein